MLAHSLDGGSGLEGRLVLIAADSPVSRGFRDDLFKHLGEDHQFGTRVVRLNSEIIEYSNHELNFRLSSPDAALSMDEVEHLLRFGDTYFVSKLENPVQQDPLRYHLDTLVDSIGGKFAQLASTSGLTDEQRMQRFFSYTATNFGRILRNVVDKRLLEKSLWDITLQLYQLCGVVGESLQAREYGSGSLSGSAQRELSMFRFAMKGFLTDLVPKQHKVVALEELKSISHRIGRKIIQPGDIGRLSWITPFLDLRSDHNNSDPHEGVRVEELADLAEFYGVRRVMMLRGHSQLGMQYFLDRGIAVDNLTHTNEYISMLVQTIDDFGDVYVETPDAGGLADAMVLARELYRRTGGKFSGRVVQLRKRRSGIGEIKDVEFEASFVYNPTKDATPDKTDSQGHPLPYDHALVHASEYKNPESPHYIGEMFDVECKESQISDLDGRIHGHTAVTRDDLVASGGTLETAMKYVHRVFGSRSIAMVEHPCFTGGAIEKLTAAYEAGYLAAVFTSNSIVHPNRSRRPWHVQRSLSKRFATSARRPYSRFIGEHFPDFHARLTEFDARGSTQTE